MYTVCYPSILCNNCFSLPLLILSKITMKIIVALGLINDVIQHPASLAPPPWCTVYMCEERAPAIVKFRLPERKAPPNDFTVEKVAEERT